MDLAPIVLFVYNRPEHTRKTLKALKENTFASQSKLYIFADGPKTDAGNEIKQKIAEVREVIREEQWCKEVTILESEVNKGLAQNIITGVTKIVNEFGKVIVLEDDIITGKYFLKYMNDALEKYREQKQVFHITGFRYPVKTDNPEGSYLYHNMDCWSWATWADRWQFFEKNPEKLMKLFDKEMKWKFNIEGVEKHNWEQIELNFQGKKNTWAIFWNAAIFLQDGLCLAPNKSLIKNVGLDNSGDNCSSNPFMTINDDINHEIKFFPEKIEENRKEFKKNKMHIKMMNKMTPIKFIKSLIPAELKKKIRLFKARFS